MDRRYKDICKGVKERRKEDIKERGTQRIEEDIQKGRKEERSKEGRK